MGVFGKRSHNTQHCHKLQWARESPRNLANLLTPLVTPESHIGVLVHVLATPLSTQLPGNAPEITALDGLSTWALATHVRHPSGSWLLTSD